jgi:hypothetical protein
MYSYRYCTTLPSIEYHSQVTYSEVSINMNSFWNTYTHSRGKHRSSHLLLSLLQRQISSSRSIPLLSNSSLLNFLLILRSRFISRAFLSGAPHTDDMRGSPFEPRAPTILPFLIPAFDVSHRRHEVRRRGRVGYLLGDGKIGVRRHHRRLDAPGARRLLGDRGILGDDGRAAPLGAARLVVGAAAVLRGGGPPAPPGRRRRRRRRRHHERRRGRPPPVVLGIREQWFLWGRVVRGYVSDDPREVPRAELAEVPIAAGGAQGAGLGGSVLRSCARSSDGHRRRGRAG